MPLYEYQCESCETRFEKIQKFSDPPVETCPSCGGRVRKLLSSPAIQFKGSGWYITDYAKKSGSGDGDSKSAKPAKDKEGASTSTADSGGSASGTAPAPSSTPAKKDPA